MGSPVYVQELLGEEFALTIQEPDTVLYADSGAQVWQLFSTAFGPTKTLADSLDAERREQQHRNRVELYESTGSATRFSATNLPVRSQAYVGSGAEANRRDTIVLLLGA